MTEDERRKKAAIKNSRYESANKKSRREYRRRMYANDPGVRSRMKAKAALRVRKIRHELLVLLGGVCQDCGNTDERVLIFHHVFQDGKDDRDGSQSGSGAYYRKLIVRVKKRKATCPIALVCSNCHCIRHWRPTDEIVKAAYK